MKNIIKLSLLAALLITNASTNANTKTDVMAIVSQANLAAFYLGDDATAQARMLISDSQGNQQIRQFSLARKDKLDGGDQDIMLKFSKPSDVKGTMLRVAKHINSDDDRWLYLPALDLVKRISAGDKRTSFVGSHFFYEDISGRNISDDNFTLVGETTSAYQIKAVPKDPDSVEFASYLVTIDKTTMLPMSIVYTNSHNQQYRKVEVLKLTEVQGKVSVVKSKASDLINGGSTVIQFRRIRYDNHMPQAIFSERSLRNPPRKWFN
ncbi:MAG: outer membrane lipoprotein-sorting protein [Gammaproteobacteria bacterium]|nr:outer membrane lipoprotein-sorting protein [Gammaproteobacteria bacterium]